MTNKSIDVAIVGAGAAGLMSAISAGRHNSLQRSIVLFDSRQKVGAKILISGGTRCNVTNVQVRPADYQGGARHFVKHVLEAFKPEETRRFFSDIGVELVLEPTGKYFPVTNSGRSVLEALLSAMRESGVRLETGIKIEEIRVSDGKFALTGKNLLGEKMEFTASRVILATGGLSLPETGSDGVGLRIAKYLGHTIIQTAPSLTPLLSKDPIWSSLSGVTTVVKLAFFEKGKKRAESAGSFLFTHTGFSGPAALDISRHVALAEKGEAEVFASFLPDEKEETLIKKIMHFKGRHPQKFLRSLLSEELGLPSRLSEVFLEKFGLDRDRTLERLTQPMIGRLAHLLLNSPLSVNGVIGYKKAEVTAGGVDLGEVRVSTMESKKVPGLYFTGEILDIDGRIGGFNFQWAWSTGFIAGKSAVGSLAS